MYIQALFHVSRRSSSLCAFVCSAITNYCVCALYLNLDCWEIAYSSACARESLIISVNDSGYESIMSHME